MRHVALIPTLALTLLAAAAPELAAAPLAPSKASQVVSGIAGMGVSSPPCPGVGGLQVSRLGMPDGTNVPFAIPPKSVLVVTSLEFLVTSADSNANVFVQVYAKEPGSGPTAVGNIAFAAGISDANGNLAGSLQLPAGLVIKPPAVLCGVESSGDLQAFIVHGFFAKDK